MELGNLKRAANTKDSLTVSVGNRTSSCVTNPILDRNNTPCHMIHTKLVLACGRVGVYISIMSENNAQELGASRPLSDIR